ncbi:hypothetical protein N7533_011385 [Penicillium manginii]|uniref:uncharacterized protein n=1 Tax=Penicillium manginii TaxID=203109 RepID=UPI0025471A5B|nr:uncharacterized protein N7533_011385 [Penicillium manginii]KAJ5741976.1 hypothetical protein N7533_011385 [Penicillium manginii]
MGRGRNQARNAPPRTRLRAKKSPSPPCDASVGDSDAEMPDADPESPSNFTFIVALDYGTTYTSVSYIKFDPKDRPDDIDLHEIQAIQNWPRAHGGTNPQNKEEVPSESWYANGQHYWGFLAFKLRQTLQIRRESIVGLNFCPKVLLSGNDEDEISRQELRQTLATLGKKETDIVTDYLVEVLRHTKIQLTLIEGYNDSCDVELVLCVPAAWDATARRDLQEIMGEVSNRAQFGSIYNFWMIHEPEAAAAMVLESETRLGATKTRINWSKGDTFIVCDAGGGTVDTITYRIEGMVPVRLVEVTKPIGSHCGSKYINDALQRKVLSMLQDETYLETDGKTLKNVVDKSVMHQFENETKQSFTNEEGESFEIQGLRENPDKHFESSLLNVPRDLSQMVSKGAILRAVNKKNGPRRQMYSSYGFLQSEEYNPEDMSHKYYDSVIHNDANGISYVRNCISWLIKKKQRLDTVHVFTCQSYQIFRQGQDWMLYESIYVSDGDVEDNLQYNHGSNKKVDMSFLRDQGLVQARQRVATSPWYWLVEYDLVMEIQGLNLKFYVKWPRGGEMQGQAGQIPIAAAFKPGTA